MKIARKKIISIIVVSFVLTLVGWKEGMIADHDAIGFFSTAVLGFIIIWKD